MTVTANPFYLPAPSPKHRPEDVVKVVAYYAERAGVEPTDADYARAGYWAAVGRTNDARVLNGMSPMGQEATWKPFKKVDGSCLICENGQIRQTDGSSKPCGTCQPRRDEEGNDLDLLDALSAPSLSDAAPEGGQSDE